VGYGLLPTDPSDALEDPDADHSDNVGEFAADTHPGDGDSYLHITNVVRETPGARVWFPCSAQRLYSLESADNLVTGAWSVVGDQSNQLGDISGAMSLVDTNEVGVKFYRIRAVVP
jgi:hypothetical protein